MCDSVLRTYLKVIGENPGLVFLFHRRTGDEALKNMTEQ